MLYNTRLADRAAPLLAAVVAQSTAEDGENVRLVAAMVYAAESWPHPRRVVYTAEAQRLPKGERGTNLRFVVTSRDDPPEALYDWYTKRGETENWIKDVKRHLKSDRLRCHRFGTNQFRLRLHAAYWLLDTVRRKLLQPGIARITLETVRLRMVKIGGRVRQRTDVVRLHVAASHPGQGWWQRLAAPPPPL